ncbi:MAG TPA: tRNA (guanosine(37)-N1)-methyltransferase TrmD [Clostridiales bacterium]|nr:tRNA (guanosine(37)-N1)-methyltransferase TrmD [Clostridiales bacterium]HBJ97538.1 tRNA (guanosine(37)-N1)-methyltransferase TrmD [Clostridiales bacterium]
MRIDILTLFPEMFVPLKTSILGRAVEKGILEIVVTDIREYTLDKHKKCDDSPFGGGAGMVMMAQPIASCVESVDPNHEAIRYYTSPKGEKLSQNLVKKLAQNKRILILCGHYEGVDQRVLDLYFDGEISIGDYVLTGGELPAMVITDAVARYVDGVISSDSLSQESFSEGLLEYPQYTRPQEFMGLKVPDVLLSGNHAEVDKWRAEKSLEITKKLRPDLLEK